MNKEFSIKAFGNKDPGLVWKNNEDNFFIFDNAHNQDIVHNAERDYLYIVADGIRELGGGEKASAMVGDCMKKYFTEDKYIQKSNVLEALKEVILETNKVIYDYSKTDDKYKGMGTTLTTALIQNNTLNIGHVGDTRIYLIREGEFLKNKRNGYNWLTEDHTTGMILVKEGFLSIEDVRTYKNRNELRQCVGFEENIEVFLDSYSLEKKDIIILCSDGLYDMIDDKKILQLFKDSVNYKKVCDELIQEANRKGGKDNITVIIISVE